LGKRKPVTKKVKRKEGFRGTARYKKVKQKKFLERMKKIVEQYKPRKERK